MIYIGGFISQYGFIELLFMLLEMLLQFQQGGLFLANGGEVNHKSILILHIVTKIHAQAVIFTYFCGS